jgi:hypothetical protein
MFEMRPVTMKKKFGRFNMELATLKGGDDSRQNILNHDWWDVLWIIIT